MRAPGAGELNRLVTIRQRADFPVEDEGGGIASVFPKQKKTWAKIEPVGSAIYSAGVQAGDLITHRVTIRYRHGITDDYEVVELVGGQPVVYRVRRSAPLGTARRFLVIEVEEL